MQRSRIFIWFFIGLLLSMYGVMILGSGIFEWTTGNYAAGGQLVHPHALIRWGGLLFALGIFYAVKFPPRRTGK